ncbi:MAG TPA: mandelate racemase/muconate lactonizing enzyme family protein [Casimicrobiaceae bacterium]
MRITRVEPFVLHVPPARKIADSVNSVEAWGVTGVRLFTDEGLVGTGYTGTCGKGDELIATTIGTYYAPALVGKDPFMVRQIWDELRWGPMHWVGRAGVVHMALAAVDIALWDLMAKSANRPLWQYLGGHKSKPIQAYDTDGGWLNLTQDQLIANCTRAVESGFTGVKLKLGKANPREDYARVKAVRQAIGPNVNLMTDVNQMWGFNTAQTWGRRLEEFDIFWLEEPLNPDDISGHARLARELAVPIALGEHVYTKYAFRDYIQAGAVEYVQIDVTRVAGITEWLQVAALAGCYDLPVMPHVGDMGQVHLHLVAATQNAPMLEYIPWIRHIFVEPITVKNGFYQLPELPGASTEILPDAFSKYRRL